MITPWPHHFPLELCHNEEHLEEIQVAGKDVSVWLYDDLWDEAETYIRERFSPEESEYLKKKIARMDKNDLMAERMA